MSDAPSSDPPPLWIYLPYVDERPTGMQRFASQMILALRRAGLPFRLLLGEVHGAPAWLQGISYRLMFKPALARRLPRFAVAFARVAWLQFMFSLVCGRDGTLLALAAELAPFPRNPQIGVAHDLTDFRDFSKRRGLAVWVKNALWKAGLRRSQAVIAISEATRRDMLDLFGLAPGKVYVVHEGFDRNLFKPRGADMGVPEHPYLLYAGTLDPHKNLPFALDVYGKLRARGERIGFKLVGPQDARAVADLRAPLLTDIRNDVQFLGFVSDAELATLMQGCAAFVFPSRNEGFGLAPVEAMGCGAPVIAAAAGSLPEVIGEGGVLLDPDDSAAWVREIGNLLSDPAHARDLSQRALARSLAFSWDAAAAEYRRIVAEHGAMAKQSASSL